MKWLVSTFSTRLLLTLAVLCFVLPEQGLAQFGISENYGPITSGFSLNRRFGWWINSATGGFEGQHLNNRNAASSHFDPSQILNNPYLPANFPSADVSPLEGSISYYEVTYSNPFDTNDDPNTPEFDGKNGGGDGILLELDVPQTDAGLNPSSYNATTYDNADANVRGQAILSIDYKLVMFGPSDQTVPTGQATIGNPTHPTDPMPYAVTDNTDVPVLADFSVLYLDRNPGSPGEPCNQGTCWNRVGGVGDPGALFSGLDTDDLRNPPNAASGGQVFSSAELTRVLLNPDGQVHTLELPFTFLTSDERAAMEWTGANRGAGPDPGNADWNNPDIFHNFRINTYGGGPRLIVWDNISITRIPEPSTAFAALMLVGCLGVVRRRMQ